MLRALTRLPPMVRFTLVIALATVAAGTVVQAVREEFSAGSVAFAIGIAGAAEIGLGALLAGAIMHREPGYPVHEHHARNFMAVATANDGFGMKRTGGVVGFVGLLALVAAIVIGVLGSRL